MDRLVQKCGLEVTLRLDVQAARLRRTMTEADDRKQRNRIAHSKPGSIIVKPARKKKIIAELE